MTSLRITFSVNACDETDFYMYSTIKKLDSFGDSIFQKIGLAYRQSDAIRKRITDNPYEAKSHFVKKMSRIGIGLEFAETLLTAKGWTRRMRLVWSFINEHERSNARKLDYSTFENYWPSLAFTDVNFPLQGVAQAPGSKTVELTA
jgi:hypothetical protein